MTKERNTPKFWEKFWAKKKTDGLSKLFFKMIHKYKHWNKKNNETTILDKFLKITTLILVPSLF